MSTTIPEESADTDLYDAILAADPSTRDSVRQYLAARKSRADDEIIVLTDIPSELEGQRIVFAAQAEGEPRTFTITPSNATGETMMVDFGSSLSKPVAINYSPATMSDMSALYRFDETGVTCVATPKVVQLMLDAAIDSGIAEYGSSPATAVAAKERPEAPEIEMRERIANIRQTIFDEGYSTNDAAAALNVKSGEAVRQRLSRKELLGIKINRDYRFPQWQFDPRSPNGVLSGLSEVLKTTKLSSLELATWFETPQSELADKTPVEALQAGEHKAVAAAAAAAGAV